MAVEGTDNRLYGMEIDLDRARQELRDLGGQNDGRQLEDILGSGAWTPRWVGGACARG